MKTDQEIIIDLCSTHQKKIDLEEHYPGYLFNIVILFPSRTCRVTDCEEDAYYRAIGIKIPESVGDIRRPKNELCLATAEIFKEAKTLLDGGTAKERLAEYLHSRIIPSKHREMLALQMIAKMAALVLEKLKIDPNCSLSDTDKHRILKELRLYPAEEEYD